MTTPAASPATPAVQSIAIPRKASPLIKRILGAFRVGDEDMLETEVEDADEMIKKLQGDNADLTEKIAAKDAEIEELKKKIPADDESGTGSAPLVVAPGTELKEQGVLMTGDTLQAVYARAEVLAPGIKMPTTDAVASPNLTTATLMRAALTAASAAREPVKALIGGRDLSKMTGDSLAVVFNAAHTVTAHANDAKLKLGAPSAAVVHDAARNRATVEDMNKKAADGWGARRAAMPGQK